MVRKILIRWTCALFLLLSCASSVLAAGHVEVLDQRSDDLRGSIDTPQTLPDHQDSRESPSAILPPAELNWIRTGGPLGGLGYDVRMRLDNHDIMFVTDAWAGVFMSQDGGHTWFPSNQGITTRVGTTGDSVPIFCLTIDPHNPDIVWAGTQNVRGIFKSTDGGETWVEMVRGIVEQEGITFRGFTVDPRSSDIVYAAGEISSWTWAGHEVQGREFDMTMGVVYKTTDGGQHWQVIWRGDNLARYVWINPDSPEVVYVSTGIFDREAANSVPEDRQPGGEGVLKSTDGGLTWENVNNGLANLYVGSLFMHPDNPDILLAGTGNNQYYDYGGVYLTTDGAASWQYVLDDEVIESVEFSRSDPNIAYAGSSNAIYRSQDGGRNWDLVSGSEYGWGPPGVRAGFPIDFEVDPADPDRIFANNYGGGNFLSEDGGHTWEDASAGYTGAQVRALVVDPAAPGRIYVAARSGLFTSPDGGGTWQGLSYPPAWVMEWNAVAVDPEDRLHILAGNNWQNTIVESYAAGHEWQHTGVPHQDGISWRVIAFAPSDSSTVYAGSAAYYSAGSFNDRMPAAGVYRSLDGGTTWHQTSPGVAADAHVGDIAIHPQDPQTVYAATTNHGVLKTVNGGGDWITANAGLPGNPMALAVAIDPASTETLYAGLHAGGLRRSPDGGTTWQLISSGLPLEATVTSIVHSPIDPSQVFIADRFSGVYLSTDAGSTWLAINQGLLNRAVEALAISSNGEHLYAATEGGGVYRLDLIGESPPVDQELAAPTEPPATEPQHPLPTPTRPAIVQQLEDPLQAPEERPRPSCGGGALPLLFVGLVLAGRITLKKSGKS